MKLICYSNDKKPEWDKFVKSSRNGLFMFERDYMDYHSDRFEDHSVMAYNDDNILIAVLPANKKEDVLYSHQGLSFGSFVISRDMKAATMIKLFSTLKDYLAGNGFNKLVYKAIPYIYHRQPSQDDLYALFRNDAKLFRVDISSALELIDRYSFAELRKRGVKKAEKNDIVVGASQDFDGFMSMLTTVLQMQHNLKPVHSAAEIKLLISRFPDNIKLFTAQKDSVLCAGVLIFEYANVVHAQYIASSLEGKNMGALDAVFNYLIEKVYADKKYFSFGVSSEDGGRYLNEGLINQKEGFGARTIVHEFFEMDLQ